MSVIRHWYAAAVFFTAAATTQASPPTLAIDSLPLAASCDAPTPANGAALVLAGTGDLYQATMTHDDWGGHFARYLFSGEGGASALAWDAGAILTGAPGSPPVPAPELRQIYTSVVQPDGSLVMVPFTWPTLSLQQQALLNLEDGQGEQRLAYLRGDRSLESTAFRQRSSVLGDAVHSTPVYAGPVEHRAVVYLGANDGMLHAFKASTGVEIFAYVPDALFAQLYHLSEAVYAHRAYVDGPASIGDALIGGEKKSILLSAMGGGAKGVFALDVTDPDNFAGGLGAVWEFTSRDDPMMGNVIAIPQIARVRVRRNVYRYFAIVPSGVNNYEDGGDGKGALFLLALDKPRTEGWKINSNYYRITTPIADKSLANALNAPVLLNDSDGALRYAYAGDLQGNLWRFDFSGNAPWSKAPGKPLFVARDAAGHRQPITQRPLLAFASVHGYMVLFGTGRLIEAADRDTATAVTQSYYAILDSLQTPPDVITSRHQLTQRFLDGSGALLSISGARMDVDSKGWYLDFIEIAERSVNAGLLADGAVLFNTVLPGTDMCSPTRSRSYALSALSGLPEGGFTAVLPGNEALVGLLLPFYAPAPVLLPPTVTSSARDALGRIVQENTYAMAQPGGAEPLTVVGRMKSIRRAGRLSWREVSNWRELHEAAK